MSGHFVKLYGSILDSSVWSEEPMTRLVWITLLAMADAEGFVESSVPGLARRANVPLADCEKALEVLAAPDPYSKSIEFEGRRIEKAPRGWTVLNYLAYREVRSPKQIADAERQQRKRDRERDASQTSREKRDESRESHTEVEVEVEVDVKALPLPEPRIRFCVAANKGLAEHPERPQLIPRVMPNSGNAYEATEKLLAIGAPVEFIEHVIYITALGHNADDEVVSLKYFVGAVKRHWDESEMTRGVRTSTLQPGTSSRRAAQGGARNDAAINNWLRKKEAEKAQHGANNGH